MASKAFNMAFNKTSGIEHTCESHRDGDWIIYTCPHPQCDFEMRENWCTGELIVKNSKARINHSGSYFPDEYKDSFENQN